MQQRQVRRADRRRDCDRHTEWLEAVDVWICIAGKLTSGPSRLITTPLVDKLPSVYGTRFALPYLQEPDESYPYLNFIFGRASDLYLCLYNQLFALFDYVFNFLKNSDMFRSYLTIFRE
jgi:hypothetical protein